MEILDALILGIAEGLTEFLPTSSTGHLILASDLLGANDERGKVFDIAIQTGAVVAVIWEYRARLFRVDPKLWLNLIVAFIPAAVLGLAFGAYIKAHLFSAVPVASAFIVGGLIILLVERKKLPSRVDSTEAMTLLDAGAYDLWKNRALFAARDLPMFALGLAAAFVSAFVVIRWLIRYVATHDFRPFAWYRIVFGAVVLLTAYFGWVSWSA